MQLFLEKNKIRFANIRDWPVFLSICIFFVFIILAIRYQIELLNYIEWGDESETIVTAKMLASNMSLYSEVFNHHGPLTFLTGFLLEKFGSFGIQGHRVPIAVLQWVALLALYYSPLLKCHFDRRLYTIVAASIMLLYFPDYFGHQYIYQVFVGLALVIILSQYTLPTILKSDSVSSGRVLVGNILIAALPFFAITYIPIAALLFLASLQKKFMGKSLCIFLGASIASIAFLIQIGSISGYFAYHIYLNSKILPPYLYPEGFGMWKLIIDAGRTVTDNLWQFTFFFGLIIAIWLMARREKGIPWRSIFVGLGIGSLLIRGNTFQELPYLYSILAIPLVFINGKTIGSQPLRIAMIFFGCFCVVKLAMLLPGDHERILSKLIPKETEFSNLVKRFTRPDDKIIAYSFQNFEYIASARLPASGYFFYLPWQEKYNEKPYFSVSINACKEIAEYRPKVMLIDKWTVWGKFPWDSYASCVQNIIDKNYIQVYGKPYYIRKDLIPNNDRLIKEDSLRKMQTSYELSNKGAIKLYIDTSKKFINKDIKRIGVLIATHFRQNPGQAEFVAFSNVGNVYRKQFSLSDLSDNKYQYFDLPSGKYTAIEIRSISGTGISTWESSSETGEVLTCMMYEYQNGRRHFTPGCPTCLFNDETCDLLYYPASGSVDQVTPVNRWKKKAFQAILGAFSIPQK